MAEGLRHRRKELSAWNGVCDAVAKNFPRGMAFATPSQRTFRVEWRLRRHRKELSAWNGVCDAVVAEGLRCRRKQHQNADTIINSK